MHCCLCGRPMARPTLFIGLMPVGPHCARRAGLMDKARKGAGALRLAGAPAIRSPGADRRTLDLFEEGANA